MKRLFLLSHLNLHIFMKIWRSKLIFLVIFLQNCFWPATKTGHNSTNMGPLELIQNVLKSSDSQLFNAFWISASGCILAEIWSRFVADRNKFCKKQIGNIWYFVILLHDISSYWAVPWQKYLKFIVGEEIAGPDEYLKKVP